MDFYEKRTWDCVERWKVANLQMKSQHYYPASVSRFTSKNVDGVFPSRGCPGSRSGMSLLFVKSAMRAEYDRYSLIEAD